MTKLERILEEFKAIAKHTKITPFIEDLENVTAQSLAREQVDSGNTRVISWHTDDVKHRAKEMNDVVLTDQQALNILESAIKGHDANIGINWEVLDVYIDMELGDEG